MCAAHKLCKYIKIDSHDEQILPLSFLPTSNGFLTFYLLMIQHQSGNPEGADQPRKSCIDSNAVDQRSNYDLSGFEVTVILT